MQELPPSAFFALDSRDEGVTPTSVYIADVAEVCHAICSELQIYLLLVKHCRPKPNVLC